jgi:exodeoxyribonuclease X
MISEQTTFLVVDTETTGFDPSRDRVCEVGALWIDIHGNILDRYESLVAPGIPIPAVSSAVHHIIDADVVGAPALDACYAAIAARAPYDVLVGHNLVDFDIKFVPKLLGGRPMLDTLRLAQRTWPDLESHKNFFLGYFHGLVTGGRGERMAHSALADCFVTGKIMVKLLEDIRNRAKDPDSVSISGLAEWQMKPRMLSKIRFGKHAGTKFAELPRDYLMWLRDKSDMCKSDPDLDHTVRAVLSR